MPSKLRVHIAALLSTLAESWSVQDDGSIRMSNWQIRFVEAALLQLLDASAVGLTRSESEACMHRAIRDTVKTGDLTAEALDAALRNEVAKRRRIKLKQFEIVCRCYFALPNKVEIEFNLLGCDLRISNSELGRLELSEFFLNGYGTVHPGEPDGGTFCRSKVRARSSMAALDIASNDIAVAFGALNFWLHLRNLRERFGKAEMRATLFPGRELFLCKDDTSLDHEIGSYYSVYPDTVRHLTESNFKRLEQLPTLYKALGGTLKKDRSFYRAFFKTYFDALSEPDVDSRLVRLWKAAELATDSTGDVDKVAARLAVPWSDKATVRAICFAVGVRRNAITHSATDGLSRENLAEVFRNLLEEFVWKSLSPDVGDRTVWKAIVELGSSEANLKTMKKALPIAMKLASSEEA